MARKEDYSVGFLRYYASLTILPKEHRARLAVAADDLTSVLVEIEQLRNENRRLKTNLAAVVKRNRSLEGLPVTTKISEPTGFERECAKCGKVYGGIGTPYCPECWPETEKGTATCPECKGARGGPGPNLGWMPCATCGGDGEIGTEDDESEQDTRCPARIIGEYDDLRCVYDKGHTGHHNYAVTDQDIAETMPPEPGH